MGAKTDLMTAIRDLVNRPDMSDATVGGWIMMAEERFNRDLRVNDMIERDTAVFMDNSAPFPLDALEIDYVKYINDGVTSNYYIQNAKPLKFVTNDEFWERADPNHDQHDHPHYTFIGRQLLIRPISESEDGTQIEIGYYNTIPPLAEDTGNWLYRKHYSAYLYASVVHSAPFLMEDERMTFWEGLTDKFIQNQNDAAVKQKFGGGPIRARHRRFG